MGWGVPGVVDRTVFSRGGRGFADNWHTKLCTLFWMSGKHACKCNENKKLNRVGFEMVPRLEGD